jgi:membrane fusion protein, multidrug efflux system
MAQQAKTDREQGKDQSEPGEFDGNQQKGDGAKKQDNDKSGDSEPEHKTPFYKRPILMTVLIGIALIGIILGTIYLVHEHYHPSTDDAFVDGRIVHVGPRVAGKVIRLDVTDNQWVDADTVLIELDPADFQARVKQSAATLAADRGRLEQSEATFDLAESDLDQAKAEVIAAQANAVNAKQDYERYANLSPEARTQQQFDQATATYKSTSAVLLAARERVSSEIAQVKADEAAIDIAKGQISADEAELEQAKLNLGYTKVISGQPGWVTRRTVEIGDYVQLGQEILDVVSPDIWITANYKETQLKHMRPGQPATIKIDAYPDEVLHGHVDSIQTGTGAVFSLLPPENATGNYVKVVQRVPVKIVLDDRPHHVLAPGMSAEPAVDVGATPEDTQQPLRESDTVGNHSGIGNRSAPGYGSAGGVSGTQP